MFHEVAGSVGRPPLRWAGFEPRLDDSVRQLFGIPPESPLESEFPYRLDGLFTLSGKWNWHRPEGTCDCAGNAGTRTSGDHLLP